ncbi:MAG: DUF2141 domain-containing protein [Pseudomonadota bacterium]
MKIQNLALIVSCAALTAVAACSTTGTSPSAPTEAADMQGVATLDVVVTAEIAEGEVRLSLFRGAEAYDGGPMTGGAILDVSSGTATASFQGLQPGRYAIRAFHDLNGNGTMDTNALGIPSEPYAFSNNARGNFGPAKFEAAAFTVTSGANTHRMNIR